VINDRIIVQQAAGANRLWRWPFGCRGSRGESPAVQHSTFGNNMIASLIDNLIMIAAGAFFIIARCRIVAKITDPQKKQRTDRILKVCGPVVLGCGILLAITTLARTDGDLERVVREVNATAPKMVDDATRLDRASAGPGRRLTYDLTLISLKSEDIDPVVWKRDVFPTIRANMAKTQAMHRLLAAGITVASRYSSSDGVLVDEIVMRPEDLSTK
jgi:hypothetical protein